MDVSIIWIFSVVYKVNHLGNSLAVQWLGLNAFTAGAWVQSLVGELRSPQATRGKKKKRKDRKKKKRKHTHTNKVNHLCLSTYQSIYHPPRNHITFGPHAP